MGHHSPSRYRREGRNAYYRGGDANCHNPYPFVPGICSKRIAWLEGWQQAAKADVDVPLTPLEELEARVASLEEFIARHVPVCAGR